MTQFRKERVGIKEEERGGGEMTHSGKNTDFVVAGFLLSVFIALWF
jgi:hypothetical protein